MEQEFFFKLLGNIGVPAAICFYTLFGVNKTLKELTDAINKMATDVQKIEKLEQQVQDLTFKVARMNWKD